METIQLAKGEEEGGRLDIKMKMSVTDLLLGAADVLHLRDKCRLTLVQRSLQLLEGPGDLDHRLHLPLIELSRDLRHKLDGRRQLREPAGPMKEHNSEHFLRTSTRLAADSIIYKDKCILLYSFVFNFF